VNTTMANDITRFTKAASRSPTLSVTPPTVSVKDVTPLPAAVAGARRGVMMSADSASKNLPTTPPR